jgi:hypothetical protein
MERKLQTWYVTGALAAFGAFALPALAVDKTDEVTRAANRIVTTIDSLDFDEYRLRLGAGERVNIVVSGNGSSDLDLYLLNGRDQAVCADDDDTDDMVCTWVAQRSGEYTIQIRNLGRTNRYVMEYY